MTYTLVEWMKTCDRSSCTFTQDRPGAGHPWLYHPYDLSLFVLSGSMTVRFENLERTLRSGDTCDIPLGLYHQLESGPTGCVYLTARPAESELTQLPTTHHYAAVYQ